MPESLTDMAQETEREAERDPTESPATSTAQETERRSVGEVETVASAAADLVEVPRTSSSSFKAADGLHIGDRC